MKYTLAIKSAIKFSIKTHELYQKQKRKGKDIAYITHPMAVGLILSLAGASEEVIVAGILHDTIEDSITEKKVDKKMITQRFGKQVAELVMSVTEKNKNWPWEKRKREAIEHIAKFSHESLLLKSADVLSNVNELTDDFNRYGEQVFSHFHAPKDKLLNNFIEAVKAILARWKGNPLKDDLESALKELERMSKVA